MTSSSTHCIYICSCILWRKFLTSEYFDDAWKVLVLKNVLFTSLVILLGVGIRSGCRAVARLAGCVVKALVVSFKVATQRAAAAIDPRHSRLACVPRHRTSDSLCRRQDRGAFLHADVMGTLSIPAPHPHITFQIMAVARIFLLGRSLTFPYFPLFSFHFIFPCLVFPLISLPKSI